MPDLDPRIYQGRSKYEEWAHHLQALLRSILTQPGYAFVTLDLNDSPPRLDLTVAPADIARVIGRYNRTIEALITLTRCWSYTTNLPVRLEVPGATRWSASAGSQPRHTTIPSRLEERS